MDKRGLVVSPADEREAFWKALGVNSDRITAIEAVMRERDESMREIILEAVRDAMPTRLPTEKQLQYLDDAIERQAQNIAFRRRIIESSAVWAVPLLILAFLAMVREYMIAHGMWKP